MSPRYGISSHLHWACNDCYFGLCFQEVREKLPEVKKQEFSKKRKSDASSLSSGSLAKNLLDKHNPEYIKELIDALTKGK